MIPCLDKGYVELIDKMGNDLTVTNAARISFSRESSELNEGDEKLIKYLADHNHWAPFAHPQLSLRIKAPISVSRQMEKHRSGLISNSESTRYIEVAEEFYIPTVMRKQSTSNKQGSEGTLDDTVPYDGPGYLQIGWHETMTAQEAAHERYIFSCQDAFDNYKLLIKMGVAKELAREILPLCTYVTWILTGSLYAFVNIVKLRAEPSAQFEIRQYANAIKGILMNEFPVASKALLGDNHV